jgi:DNA-binding transcriptional ArsR family regulator
METVLKKDARRAAGQAQFAYPGLDRIIHEHARLSILTALMTHTPGLSFIELKKSCDLTDGNLSRHMQVLEEAGVVTILKGIECNRSLTLYRVTSEGRRRYIDYLAVLERIVSDAGDAMEVGTNKSAAPKISRS